MPRRNPEIFGLAVLMIMIWDIMAGIWETWGGEMRVVHGVSVSVWADYSSSRTKEISVGGRKE